MLKVGLFGILNTSRRNMEKDFKINKKPTFFEWLCKFVGNLFFYTCLTLALGLVVFTFCLTECEVTGASMQPTLNKLSPNKHDTVYLNKFNKSYAYGDIVVIESGDEAIIKRVIGLSGDVIDVVCTYPNGLTPIYKLELNGKIVDEGYILISGFDTPTDLQNGMYKTFENFQALKETHPEQFNADGKLVVGDGKIFVLGDNRAVSSDSSSHGVFEMSQVTGKVEKIRYYEENQILFVIDYLWKGDFLKTIVNALI